MTTSSTTDPAPSVLLAQICEGPLDLAGCASLVTSDWTGAVATFVGVVRDHDGGRTVGELRYSHHPIAQATLQKVAEHIAWLYPGTRIAVSHRIGDLVVGDAAIVSAVSAAHREIAFEACQLLVDRVKAQVPIWKEQVYADGSRDWVAAGGPAKAPSAQFVGAAQQQGADVLRLS